MLTLSNGYYKPETGDKGDVFFPRLEDNFQRLNDHNHQGTNSSVLTSPAITSSSSTLLAAGWVLVGGGIYRQLVTLPSSMLFEEKIISARITSGANAGSMFYPRVLKASATTFYVYINDNSVDVKVLYS